MICISPTIINNPKLSTSAPGPFIQVPCRKCQPCLDKRAKEWIFRLQQEDRISHSSLFMTYTYETPPMSSNGLLTLSKNDHTLFMKNLRHECKGYPLKYYMCAEYGGNTQRPHYHSILFNVPKSIYGKPGRLAQIWKHGLISIDTVTSASIAYVTGYVNKQKWFTSTSPDDDRLPEYSRMSKNLGANFLTDARIQKLKRDLNPTIHIQGGSTIALPKYYQRKAFDDAEQKIVSRKAQKYAEANPAFTPIIDKYGIEQYNDQAHRDYVKAAEIKRRNTARNTRNKN